MKTILLWVSLLIGIISQAQDSLTNELELLPFDTLAVPNAKQQDLDKKPLSPKQIGLYSLVLPGSGHIINKKYLKLPIAYVGVGAAIYGIQFNTRRYNLLQDAYCAKLIKEQARKPELGCPPLSNASLNEAATFDLLVESYSSNSIKSLRDTYDKNRQLSWMGLFVGHLVLNGVWSFVDAHLNDFDMSEDLSFRIKPSVELAPTPIVGVGVTLQMRSK
ncbi:MAG: hypothetical protein HC892_12160 [Saprospiraceae bacterium]|nr:hypothetical protein [Saprospiraceae bacterium]